MHAYAHFYYVACLFSLKGFYFYLFSFLHPPAAVLNLLFSACNTCMGSFLH